MKQWKVGVVGCGNIAETVYLPQMKQLEDVKLTAVCDLSAERAEYIAGKFGADEWYSDVDRFLQEADVEIVMSLGAIQGRHELNMKILNAGKHLYTQKPFAATVEEATAQIEAAREKQVILSTAPVHRNRPDIRWTKKLLDQNLIGHVSLVKIDVSHGGPEYFQYRDSDPSWFYRKGAGSLMDIGIHGIDQMVALLGAAKYVSCMAAVSEPVRTVRTGKYDGKIIQADELFDNYIITLDFGEGTLGVVTSGFVQKASANPEVGIEIYGREGTLVVGGGVAFSGIAEVKAFVDKPEAGLRGWIKPLPLKEAPQTEYFQCQCLSDLIEAAEEGHPSRLSPEHSRHVIEILEAIPEAIRTGGKVALKTTI